MPKVVTETSSVPRRTRRVKKKVKHSVTDLAKAAALRIEMPPGYDPSDDSDDDYVDKKRKKSSLNNSQLQSRKEEVKMPSDYNPSDDSDDYIPKARKNSDEDLKFKSRRSTPGRKPKVNLVKSNIKAILPNTTSILTSEAEKAIKSEPNAEEIIPCLFCKESLKVNTNARFHYSVHYYDDNAFISLLKPKDDLVDGKVQDESGLVHKYICPYDGCTKRKMGYKEMCIHLATAHLQLKHYMKIDKRAGVKDVLEVLFPKEKNKAKEQAPVKVKEPQYKIVRVAPIIEHENENSENVDDPEYEQNFHISRKTKDQNLKAKLELKTEKGFTSLIVDKLHHCLICNSRGKICKDGRNLNFGSGLSSLKYHYSVCIYYIQGFSSLVAHGQGNIKYDEVEEYGVKFKYTCPFPDCTLNNRRNKPVGYKEYAIHCGVWHHQIEKWMLADDRPGMREVQEILKHTRELEGEVLEDMPPVITERLYTCLICKGEDVEGRNLSFTGDNVCTTRYHYAACYYGEDVYPTMYSPGPENMDKEGRPKDCLGKVVRYSCEEKGCTVTRNMGYKEFSIHMSNDHGGLEELMKKDLREEVRKLVSMMKRKY